MFEYNKMTRKYISYHKHIIDAGYSPAYCGVNVHLIILLVSLLDSLDSTLNTTTSPKASVPGEGSREGGLRDNLGQTLPDSLKTRTGTGKS